MLNNWYQTFVKDKTLSKIIMMYSLIAIITVFVLAQAIYKNMLDSAVEGQMETQRRALESINEYMQKNYDYLEQITNEIYSQSALADNVSYFLMHTYSEYVDYSLNQITGSGVSYWDVTTFLGRKMDDNLAIKEIILYGIDSQQLYHLQQGGLKTYYLNPERSYVPGAIINDTDRVSSPNLWIRKLIGGDQKRMYTTRINITNRYNLKSVGYLLVNYDSDYIESVTAPFEEKLKGNLLVLSPKGQVLYDQSGEYYDKPFPYREQLVTQSELSALDKEAWVSTLQNDSGVILLSIVPKAEIVAGLADTRRTIVFLSALCILVIILIPFGFAMNYTKRMHQIIRSMRSVETGELYVRIPISRKDELGLIAGSFNQMLNKLTHHINLSYKAEAEQSRAEMTALQARVNPHFLFNTLEVIRMRAVSLGAAEVGDMVFNLANLFRNLVQEETVISLQQEIENCRLYLDLFKSRYQDNFSYEIRLDPTINEHRIIKLSLQVVVENFIVHGLRDDDTVNQIVVSAEKTGGYIRITISDNGMGIEEERLELIRNSLSQRKESTNSFGLRSVYQRLVYLYGDSCTMDLNSKVGTGTTITISMPCAGEEL